ncbi:MAG: acyltransferase [Proteobacteria bacterium]|nr:acyltransferase [Pseudomonadota bacterium]
MCPPDYDKYGIFMRSLNLAYEPRLDHIRCLAASMLFLFHLYHLNYLHWQPASDRPWLGLLVEGHTGVGLFFTLSGFLFMSIALHYDHLNYADFVRNRFLRIFPLFVTVYFIAISVSRDRFNAQDVLYLFFSNLGQAPTSNSFITGAAWTISVEFTFYLVFPFLGRFAKEQGVPYLLRLLALMLVFKVGAYFVTERSTHMFYSTLVGRFDQFLIGMLAAMLSARWKQQMVRYGTPLLVLAAILVVAACTAQARYASYFLPQPKQVFWIFWSFIESGCWALFICAWLAAPLRIPVWLDRALCRGGEISFSFYLLHGLVLFILHELLGELKITGRVWLDGGVLVLIAYPLVWIVANLSYQAIEKPFLTLRRRYGEGAA